MIVIVTKQFSKDVQKELNKSLQLQLAEIIEVLQKANSLQEIANIKKLKGYKKAYRIKLDDFRIGFILEENKIQLSRVLNRKEIYRFFP
ncbi:MAG: type II toxin-antitoxin system RelE/ParE family toxin [Bacteroidetes bacterium]|nr:type II toxin-antitoxin system RelE/ParE family toxin [Bacteroidota bacterium]MBS1643273.1 type II toxin-antitoxin system RelE/ParE family toxin [Bacteroidota bacterium]MBS1670437.1 type II toxin-antitoxin system RelE/ParE family toxin [Bacteroidota bacterium]